MTKYTIEPWIGPRSIIEALSSEKAAAVWVAETGGMTPGMTVPNEITIYHGREKMVLSPQEIVDAYAASLNIASWDTDNLRGL